MSETKNDSEQVPEELDNQVDTVGEETSSESVTSLFQRLRIPFMVSVVDESGDRGQVVPLGNRQNPIGSANIEYRGLFVTADEHAVLESGNPSNTAFTNCIKEARDNYSRIPFETDWDSTLSNSRHILQRLKIL